MTGILLLDKPVGPTSHDVVARIRNVTGERSIGHTGTLDPRASGLLPLVLGKATRLASLLTGTDKTYDALVIFGTATTTDDADGTPTGPRSTTMPTEDEVDAALEAFRGSFDQMPPAYSAKKVGGKKAYDLARQDLPVTLSPVRVTVHALDRTSPLAGDRVSLRVTASAGFYVRGLARDLGARLGCGAHLGELRRTQSGRFSVDAAMPLAEAERLGKGLEAYLVSSSDALGHLPVVQLTPTGLVRASHGNSIGPQHLESGDFPVLAGLTGQSPVRLLSPDGTLLALAEARSGALHPVIVLG